MDIPDSRVPPEVLGLPFFPQQWRAVTAPLGPVLVLAGPGAGKTRCLTGRIGHLLAHRNADPQKICAITFTNKAAQEIASRLNNRLGDRCEQLTLGTIHSLCLQILRSHGRRVGLPTGFGVADEGHQRLVLSRFGVHTKRHGQLLLLFGRRRLQGYALTPPDEVLFNRYQQELRSNHLIDYDEILFLTRTLLESHEGLRSQYQARWEHILVDEFQDLDLTQYAIIKLFAESHRSLFVGGDDEQSIFSWRGADSRVIARFVTEFAIAEPIVLDVNCRCSKAIFEAARRILPPGELPFDKEITAVRDAPYPVQAVRCENEDEELSWLVNDLQEEFASSDLRRGDWAILYRTHQMGQQVEEALVAAGIPCQMAKGQALSDDLVITQVLASLRIVLGPDADLLVENLAQKVFPEAVLAEIQRMPGASFLKKLRGHAQQKVGADSAKCWRFLYQVENLKGLKRGPGSLPELIQAILAQGIGHYESPLDKCQEQLLDPETLPMARALGDQILQAFARGGKVVLTAGDGLEIPIKVMLQRTLPELPVEYLDRPLSINERDMVIALDPKDLPPGFPEIALSAVPSQLRITQMFKALQYVESRQYRKLFSEFVVFDTETTGKDISYCEIIELAAVKVQHGEVVETFHALMQNTRPISPGATAVHGYTDQDLQGQPSFSDVWRRFRQFVGDRVLVVHNGYQFDIPLLERLTASCGGIAGLVFFDTLVLARSLFPVGGLRLEDLARRFGVETGRSHHALDDSLCLTKVFEHLQDERLRRSRKTCLANLLDCIALGAALQNQPAICPEDQALLAASTEHGLHPQASVIDCYVEEVERLGRTYPPLAELFDRLTGKNVWHGARQQGMGQDRHPESVARLSRLLAGLRTVNMEDRIRELLDRVALSTSEGAGIDPNRVSLLTFHATKGLEFARVYLLGVEDHQLPGYYALIDNRVDDIREARRLLYVAMTRAKDKLTLTFCHHRHGRPSGGTLFLDQIGLTCPSPVVVRR